MDLPGSDSEPAHRAAPRHMGNMIGMPNYAIALGCFKGGRVWVEDDEGTSPDEVVMKNKIHQPLCFNARRFHKVEPHKGHMWAIAAYTPTAFKRCSNENHEELASLGFPVP